MKIAIVGTGIAGLTAAYYLNPEHEVTVYEQGNHVGGHANTVVLQAGDSEIGLDTGFLVYNETTYPNFTRLLKDLDVATQPSEMSFSVQCRRCAVEYSARSVRGLFARTDQLFRPRFHRMLLEVLRFNRLGLAALEAPPDLRQTLGGFLQQHRFSREFVRHYVTPMASAIWSATTANSEGFPLHFFLRFFAHHGLLSVAQQPVWRTITGGSRRYVSALTRSFGDRIHLRRPVRSVRRHASGVELGFDGGERANFDRVVLATHSNQALAILEDPSDHELGALRALPYQRNEAILHTDERILPNSRYAWASWNYHMQDCEQVDAALPMTYYLNCLQRIESPTSYCVTLNDTGLVAPERILERIPYEHPLYNTDSLEAQQRLRALNGERHTFYCGAYLGFGFHEDGVNAGLDVVRALTRSRKAA
jgi:predicted NAD/FAD-binding protein